MTKQNSLTNNTESDPTSTAYAKKINNKAHNNSPYGKNEPSTQTTYK
ncbi:hypothetical protein ACQPU1_00120 [Clostridium paraputrificum]